MKKLTFAIIALLGMGFGASAQAPNNAASQNVSVVVPEVALLDIISGSGAANTNVTLTFKSDGAGKKIILDAANSTGVSDTHLIYSSIVSATAGANADLSRSIKVSSTNVPAGILPTAVVTGAIVGVGGSSLGSATSAASPLAAASGTSPSIITAIGSCYTGTAVTSGATVTYSASADDSAYASIMATSATGTVMVVTYTLTDN